MCCTSACYNLGCWTLYFRSGGLEPNRVPSLDRFCGWVYGSCFFCPAALHRINHQRSTPSIVSEKTQRRLSIEVRDVNYPPTLRVISRQVVALLERLRQEVSSLTSSTYEELVALSIDALETDFHAPGAAAGGTSDRSNDDPATESATRESQQAPRGRGALFNRDFRQPAIGVSDSIDVLVRKDLQSPSGSPGPQSSQSDATNHSSFAPPVV